MLLNTALEEHIRTGRKERSEIIREIKDYDKLKKEWIRNQVLKHNRIDILATQVLNYIVRPFHLSMMVYQFQHSDNLQLAFRGAGKSTVCTVTKVIHLLLKNPDLRIMIASKTAPNAEGFLKEIKGHFESNELLAEIFGEYYDPRKVNKWDNKEIEVLPRTSNAKEASVTCVGVDGTIVSKHYDIIIGDDLVDEENSRTEHMRKKTQTWYYKTLEPTLEPPDSEVEHRGEFHRLGTRYHFEDLYGHLIKNELKEHHQIIRALNDKGQSPWHKKYPPAWFAKKRTKAGIIIFNTQYQCDTEAMKGEIFQYDDCRLIDIEDVPDNLKIYVGVDLAIKQSETADLFAIVAIGIDHIPNYYFLDYLEGRYRFNTQTRKILDFNERYNPIRIGVESNAYQESQIHNLKFEEEQHNIKNPNTEDKIRVPVIPVPTLKDKVTNAWRLSPDFEDGRVFFVKTPRVHLAIERFVLFPNGPKDLFDAYNIAVGASKRKKRKKRKIEPGLI